MTLAATACLLAVLTAVACALPGTFVVLQGQAMLIDGIGHAVLPGIAVGYLLTSDIDSPLLLITAAAGALDSLLGSLTDTAADILDPGKLEDLVARHAGSAQHELDSLMHVTLPEGLNALGTRQTGY